MKETKKMSIDFTNDAIDLINIAKKNYFWTKNKRASNSLVVNNLVENVLGCPNDLSHEIIKSLKSLLGHYNLILLNDKQNQFHSGDYIRKTEILKEVITLFNRFEIKKEKDNMRKIALGYNRSIVFPTDWVLLNEEDALCSSEGYVLECRNHDRYNIPHFLFLGDESAIKHGNYTNDFKTDFYNRILDVFPDFQYVLDNQIDLIITDGKIMNGEEYEVCPTIGIFKIINSKDLKKMREYDKKYEPPCGAVVEINAK